ncbi:MAG: hypothetical protein JXR88_04095 [Clostridia bacterium]|nr:hypothetical protein [Clostridia bacterium]
MKRLIWLFALITTLFFVGCSDQTETNATKIEEPEIDFLALQNLERVENFLTEQNIPWDENYSTIYLNVNGNAVEELFIVPKVQGEVLVLTLDDQGTYELLKSSIQGNLDTKIILDHNLILVDSLFETHEKSGQTLSVFKYIDGEIKALVKPQILLNEKSILDYELDTYEMTSSTYEFLSDEAFKVILTSQYIDEFKNVYDYRNIEYYYTFNANKNTFEVEEVDNSPFNSISQLKETIFTYGTDDTLMAFDEVFDTNGIVGAIDYYSEHRSEFVEGKKEAFADSIITKLYDAVRYYDFYAKNLLDYALVTEENTISFPRKEGQMESNVQEAFGYFISYKVTEKSTFEEGLRIMFKNHELSKKIYALSGDTTQKTFANVVSKHLVHADPGEETFIENPVKIINQESINENHEPSILLLPLTLTDEPVEWLDMNDFSIGDTINGVNINYKHEDDERFYFTFVANVTVEGYLKFMPSTEMIAMEITTPSLGHWKYAYENRILRMDVLTGYHHVQGYTIEEKLGSDALDRLKSGETIKVSGTVDNFMLSGYKDLPDVNDYPSLWFKNLKIIE